VLSLTSTSLRLDELRSRAAVSTADADHLLELLELGGSAASYFFRRDYSNPRWLRPLRESGAFQQYSHVDSTTRTQWIVFRELASYLSRVAKAEPEQVADVLASLTTNDAWATGQFMKATLALPDECAAKVVPQFDKWYPKGNPFAREDEVVELARRMLEARHLREFRLLLGLLLKPVKKAAERVGGIFFDDDLTMFVRDREDYKKFCESAPFECLDVAEKSLRGAVPLRERAAAERWKGVGLERGRKADPSSGLRSTIEEHGQNQYPDFEDGLVVAVRDALAACVNHSPPKAERIVRKYLRSKWSIFRRLALHTLTENTETYPRLAKSAVFRRLHGLSFFDDADLHHEYWRLVPAVFGSLSKSQQGRLVKWVLAGGGREDERERRWFAHDRLYLLKDCALPKQARERFDELMSELGEPEHPDFLEYSTSWAGAVSPERAANLENMTVDEIYKFLDTWRPDPGRPAPFGPSYSGVGQELRRVLRADLTKGLKLMEKMVDSVATWMADESKRYWATYVGYALDAFQQACRDGETFAWTGVLSLADAVVPAGLPPDQWPDPTPGERDFPELGYDWSGVRHALVHLLEDGIGTDRTATIPDSELPRVRDILVRLTTDLFPSPEHEHEREKETAGKPTTGPAYWYHLAINTNRPEAANALLRYAIRHANPIVRDKRKEPRVEPAVLEALSRLAIDDSRSVHAMLGSWLGVLWWLDGDWLKAQLDSILPPRPEQSGLWEAAWVAFLQYGSLFHDLHPHLVSHYERSIDKCAAAKEDDSHLKGLCKHLVAVYTWGWDVGSEDDALLTRFYSRARDDAASELADAFGRFAQSLDEAGDEAPCYWRRIETAVRKRLTHIGPRAEHHSKELRAFGTWLDVFVERSASDLEGMVDVLDVVTSVSLGHWQFERVAEFLDAQAEAHPEIATRLLLRTLAKCDRDAWYWEREKINAVLDKAFASASSDARRNAVEIVERLWEEGEWEPFEKHREQIAEFIAAS